MAGFRHALRRICPPGAVAAALLSVASAIPAKAADPKAIGKTGEFIAYRYEEGEKPVCYIVTRPDKSAGPHPGRGQAYTLITHRPAQGSMNVISIVGGYTYKPRSEVKLKIGDKQFTLFTKDDTAWALDQATDNAIAAAIRTGLTMTVEGISDRDVQIVDIYELGGSNRALNIIDRACRQSASEQPAERRSQRRRRR